MQLHPQRRLGAHRHRGYAMAIVLLVCVLLSMALASMFFALGAATKVTAKNLGTRRAQYICDGVVTLAANEVRKANMPPLRSGPGFGGGFRLSPTPSEAELNRLLDPLRQGVRPDGVSIVLEGGFTPSGLQQTATVPSGGFAGMEVSLLDLELKVAMTAPEAPPCSASQVLPLGSMSLFQLPAFSVNSLNIFEPGSGRFSLPNRNGYVWAKDFANVDVRMQELTARTAGDTTLSLTQPPEGIPAPRPTDLKFWTQVPSTGFAVDAPRESATTRSRAAWEADIRIIDGEWYLKPAEPAPNSWPGELIYSDHPCTDLRDDVGCSNVVSKNHRQWRDNSLPMRRLFSYYERNQFGFLDGAVVGGLAAGVVSYGSIVGGSGADLQTPAGFSSTVCTVAAGADPFVRFDTCGPASSNRERPKAALADAARGGFQDPDDGPLMPINIDIGQLGAALATRANGELGTRICFPDRIDDPGECRRVFNGIVYVSASRGSPVTAAAVNVSPPPSDSRVGRKLPWALCGLLSNEQSSLEGGERVGQFKAQILTGCEDVDYARIDAVRLLRATNLASFTNTGLTIVTDLPVYVDGDYNGGQRAAIIADRITARSTQYSDRFAPPFGVIAFPSRASGAPRPEVTIQASLFTGAPDGRLENIVRVVEDDFTLSVRGALAIGWTSAGDRRPNRFVWEYPSGLFSAGARSQPPGAPRGSFVLPGGRR